MKQWTPQQVAQAAGARLVGPSTSPNGPPPGPGQGPSATRPPGPERVTIDSRDAGPGALFVGLPGATHHGGAFAHRALAAGAWGVLTTPEHAQPAAQGRPAGQGRPADQAQPAAQGRPAGTGSRAAAVLAAEDPLTALQRLATAWRRELDAHVIGVTGSTGKTSTKDLLLALLVPHRRTIASRANFNTEIGLPLEILAAPVGTEVMVLEMGMRGRGQIAELAAIAEPDVAVIVSVGPVHLELLGTVENVVAAKAELIAALHPGSTAILPAGETLLDPHRRADVRTVTFGEGGDVHRLSEDDEHVVIEAQGERIELEVPFRQAHLRFNLLAAVAAARAVGVTPGGRVQVALSAGRGEVVELPGGITVIDGCYNANPMSMRAALSDLAATAGRTVPDRAPDGRTGARRRVAVLGDMLELGPQARSYHQALGELATRAQVDLLVTVGPLAKAIADRFDGPIRSLDSATEAAEAVPALLQPGDVVLVKGSLGVGLKAVCAALGVGVAA